MSVEEYLNKALSMARSMCGPNGAGMGSVHLHFDPYACQWGAFADWSDSSRIVGEFYDDPLNAAMSLCDALTAMCASTSK
jgi:hypothetical protein